MRKENQWRCSNYVVYSFGVNLSVCLGGARARARVFLSVCMYVLRRQKADNCYILYFRSYAHNNGPISGGSVTKIADWGSRQREWDPSFHLCQGDCVRTFRWFSWSHCFAGKIKFPFLWAPSNRVSRDYHMKQFELSSSSLVLYIYIFVSKAIVTIFSCVNGFLFYFYFFIE